MVYNNLFPVKYYSWRKTTKSDWDTDGWYDEEQYKFCDTIERVKFKDDLDYTVNDCTISPLDSEFYYWARLYKDRTPPIPICLGVLKDKTKKYDDYIKE